MPAACRSILNTWALSGPLMQDAATTRGVLPLLLPARLSLHLRWLSTFSSSFSWRIRCSCGTLLQSQQQRWRQQAQGSIPVGLQTPGCTRCAVLMMRRRNGWSLDTVSLLCDICATTMAVAQRNRWLMQTAASTTHHESHSAPGSAVRMSTYKLCVATKCSRLRSYLSTTLHSCSSCTSSCCCCC